jgi:2C-methyl-D-erythritol 2,4-cyclodiphosphate synthase
VITLPLKDEEVESTFDRHQKIFKERILSEVESTEYFLQFIDIHIRINNPRKYPYANKMNASIALSLLISEQKIMKVGGNFYTTPSNFKKFLKKSKKRSVLSF